MIIEYPFCLFFVGLDSFYSYFDAYYGVVLSVKI